jgi:hypothetical protein
MVCYIVIFELKDSSRLSALKENLKSFPGFCPLTPHVWAITTDKKAKDVRDQLTASLGPGDQLFVLRSGTEGAWRNSYGEQHNQWLKKNL